MNLELMHDIMTYLKAEDDEALEGIVSAAIELCQNETGKEFDASKPLYLQAVKMIAADWHEHRGVTTTENIKELPLSIHVQNILNHIAISTDYEEASEETP